MKKRFLSCVVSAAVLTTSALSANAIELVADNSEDNAVNKADVLPVEDNAAEITALTVRPAVEICAELVSGYDEVIEFGESVKGYLYPDGRLHICGKGVIGETELTEKAKERIKTITFGQDEDTNITDIGELAFCDFKNLESITIPSTVDTIGRGAFAGCESLTTITVPATVKIVDDYAFSGCSGLKEIVIENGVERLGNNMFQSCTALEKVTFPFIDDAEFPQGGISEYFSGYGIISDLEYPADGGGCGIPKSLEVIEINGGSRVPDNAFRGLEGVKKIVLPSTIKVVGENAFYNCAALEESPLNEGVVDIGILAFRGCVSLTSFEIPSSVRTIGQGAFAVCEGLTKFTVPATVEKIDSYTFTRCTGMKEIVIENGVDLIGSNFFSGCTALEKVTFPFVEQPTASDYLVARFFGMSCDPELEYTVGNSSVPKSLKEIVINGGEKVPDTAFAGLKGVKHIELAPTIKIIGDSAFRNCESLEELPINYGVVFIGIGAFSGCSSASYDVFMIPSSVKEIGSGAFAKCEGVTKFVVPDSVEIMGDYVFSGCSGLKEVVIKNGVQDYGCYLFDRCYSLESITLPFIDPDISAGTADGGIGGQLFNEMSEISDTSYNVPGSTGSVPRSLTRITVTGGETIPDRAFVGLASVRKITIPNSVKYIGSGAFQDCAGLEVLPITNNTVSIGNGAFAGCSSAVYDTLTIPDSVEEIGSGAFYGCEGIKKIVVSGTVKRIGESAFRNCTSLKECVIGDGVESIGENILGGSNALEKLSVPFTGRDRSNSNSLYIPSLFGDMNDSDLTYNVPGGRHVPKSLTEVTVTGGDIVPDNAFGGMISLRTVRLPETITEIGNGAFAMCTELDTLSVTGDASARSGEFSIPYSVKTIGTGAFSRCNFKKVYVPDTVREIGDSVFTGCESLTDAVIGDGVESIGMNIFGSCESLESIVIPFANIAPKTATQSAALVDMLFDRSASGEKFYNAGSGRSAVPKSLKSIVITSGTEIPDFSFLDMCSLEKIVLPDSVNTIGMLAFSGCTGLESIDLMGDKDYLDNIDLMGDNDVFTDTVKTYDAMTTVLRPEDAEVTDGDRAVFTYIAAGSRVKYQWQYSYDGGKTWADMANCTDSVCSFNASEKQNGFLYRCVAKNKSGLTLVSDSVKLIVAKAEQPFVKGDVNGDGKLDEKDAAALESWLLGGSEELVNWEAADLCKDRAIDMYDLCILRSMLKK